MITLAILWHLLFGAPPPERPFIGRATCTTTVAGSQHSTVCRLDR